MNILDADLIFGGGFHGAHHDENRFVCIIIKCIFYVFNTANMCKYIVREIQKNMKYCNL